MPSSLKDIADVVMGYSPPGDTCNTSGIGLPLLNGPTEYGAFHPVPVQFTTEPRRLAEPGDLLFCVRGSTTGRMNWADQQYAIGRGIAAIRHRSGSAYQSYLRAVVEYQLPTLLGLATGSTFPSVARDDIAGIAVPDLDSDEQLSISRFLQTLDDKIEQNRRTGAKLEGLARAVFKAWFVDFEPVKAKAAGATAFPGMPPETFAALPTRLDDSELGPVPLGWDVRTMDNIGTQRREQIAPEDTDGETPYIGLEHMPRRDIALSDWGTAASVTSSKFRFRRGDILFGKLRPYFHKVGRAAIDGMCSTDIVVLHPKKPESAAWLLMLVSSDEFVAHTDRSSAGTKMPRTNWKDMAAFKTTLPPSQVVLAFQEQVGSMLDLITASIHESRRLATLRDYLLPRLLSGRVRVRGEIT